MSKNIKTPVKKLSLKEQVTEYQDLVEILQVGSAQDAKTIATLTTKLDDYKDLVEAVKALKIVFKQLKLNKPSSKKFWYWAKAIFSSQFREALARVLNVVKEIVESKI